MKDEVRTMPNHLGPLEVECDAPAYAIVRACRKLGICEPEDVRWCRKGRRSRRSHSWIEFFSPLWEHLTGRGERDATLCVCGWSLPLLENYSFTFLSGEQVEYELGQCPRCRTIFWEKI
jgi:hypothetical protein